jgi:hypothetical protein
MLEEGVAVSWLLFDRKIAITAITTLWLWRDSSDAIAEKRDRQVYNCVAYVVDGARVGLWVRRGGVHIGEIGTSALGAEQSGHRLLPMRTMESSVHLDL